MRIALVVHDMDYRVGHGRYCVELADRLASRHEIHIVANRFNPGRDLHVVRHPVRAWRRSALLSVLTFLVSAERALKASRFDLVHSQGMAGWTADVVTAHVCNRARYQSDPPRSLAQRVFPTIVVPLEAAFYRQRNLKHLIAISNAVRMDITRSYGWDRESTVIYHGTNTRAFYPAESLEAKQARRLELTLPPVGPVWAFVGEAAKGLDAAIRQLPKFPSANLLAVTRSKPDAYMAVAAQLGVADRLHFRGPLDDTCRAYQAADVLVYPSRYDTFGLVVSEAMACGLPVIIGRDIGAAEWIEPRRNGLLCNPEQQNSIEAELRWLEEHPADARNIGIEARRTVLEHDWDRCAMETERCYRKVVDARPHSAMNRL